MMRRRIGVLAVGLLMVFAPTTWLMMTGQAQNAADNGTITGVVTSDKGPEAGVWVIAETTDLPTKVRKIVVTGDGGKFLLPQLPKANYTVWSRGYGLLDSPKVPAAVGADIKLAPQTAKTPQEAALIYPSNWWFALMEVPPVSAFPGTGPAGNQISPAIKTQDEFLFQLNGCLRCHQLGNEYTRDIPKGSESEYTSLEDSWDKRVRMGQRANEMNSLATSFGRPTYIKMFSDWTRRMRAGEVPPAPKRPEGVERNIVLTEWEWGTTMTKIHDIAATDKRNPNVAPNTPIYGTDIATDNLAILDPMSNSWKRLLIPTLEDRKGMTPNYAQTNYTSRVGVLDRFNPTNIHNPMKDQDGRVWYTASLRRPTAQPLFCKAGSTNKYAAYFPLDRSGRNISFYDPKTEKFTMIDTCAGTHHLMFGFDPNNTLYMSSPSGSTYSWINTKEFLRTGSGETSQGWCPQVVDTNGDGKITKPWNEPGRRAAEDEEGDARYDNFDPKKDTRVEIGGYGIITNKLDGSVWGAQESYPGKIIRMSIGANPPETCMAEVYEVPSERWAATGPNDLRGSKPRGIDVDKKGVIWTALSASGQMASFDRSKCKTTSKGPEAHTGRVCAEGWKIYPLPATYYKGTKTLADYYYYNFVDQFNTFGLGEDIPVATGTGSDSLIAVIPSTGKTVMMRVPYPMGAFHPRGMDGRVDDPKTGWKGKGVWSASAQDAVWQDEDGIKFENGKFTIAETPIVVKFQIRPNPLAN